MDHPQNPRPSKLWLLIVGTLGVLVAIGAFSWMNTGSKEAAAEPKHEASAKNGNSNNSKIRVEVSKPTKGGIQRTSTQPGSVHAFESANLYAHVSGYLKKQPVDIGTKVKEGDVLAEIDAPELVKALDQSKSKLIQAHAQVKQAQSRVKTAEAEHEAAQALIAQNEADLEHANATYDYRVKAYNRIAALHKQNAVDERLVDEKLDQREAALANKHSAAASILTAKAQASAAAAKIDQAKADLAEAEANVQVAQSEVEKAQVYVDYLKIISPYDGVITRRTFFRGDFIRSADQGATEPLLSVDRTDKMRVVIKVPDRDVPYTNVGDPAVVRIDALGEEALKGTVARMANSEDPDTRTMRTEVDLPNDDGRLRDGMYGSVTVILDKNAKALTVPSSAMTGESTKGKGTLYVVKDGKAHRQAVRVGIDNGLETEVLSGLEPDSEVITRPPAGLTDGAVVEAVQAEKKATTVASGEHH